MSREKPSALLIGRDPSLFGEKNVGDFESRLDHYSEYLEKCRVLSSGGSIGSKPIKTGNIEIMGVPSNPILYLIAGFWRGLGLLGKDIKLISTQDPFLCGVLGWSLKKCSCLLGHKSKLIIDLHADVIDNPEWINEGWLNGLLNGFGKFILKEADAVRVVSDAIGEKIERIGVPRERVFFVPVGTDILSKVKKCRKRKGNGTGLLFVGRLVKGKNVELLLRASAEMKRMGLEHTMKIVGDGPERENLEKLCNELRCGDTVAFFGAVPHDKLGQYYCNSDALLLPSSHEGWGLVAIEAFAYGIPVIVSKAVEKVNPTVVDGESALVVREIGVDALVDAVHEFSSLPKKKREEMAKKGLEKSMEFDIRNVAKRRAEIFRKVLGQD